MTFQRYIVLACSILLFAGMSYAERDADSQNISTSGGSVTILNRYGSMTVSFEELISGSPATVSIIIAGCKKGATCDTLETNTSTAVAQIRNPTVSTIYDYFTVT